jgi:YggT family protein
MKIFLIQILDMYMIVIVVRVIMSWIQVSHTNPIVGLVYSLTEPVLDPVRRILPNMGGFDISPIVVFFLYNYIIKSFILSI